MKKFFVLTLLLVFSFGLSACREKDKTPVVTEEDLPSGAPAEEVLPLAEEVEKVSTDAWHKFETELFTVKYPDGFEPSEYGKFVTFSPRDFEKGQGFYWTVNVVPNRENTVENMITGMGAQYAKDRNVKRNDIKIDQLSALRVLITTERDADFYYEAVLVETDADVYFISNTQKQDPAFTAFYGSFRLK